MAKLFVLISSLLLLTSQAIAWDAHHFITDSILLGLSTRDAALWQRLNTPIQVHSIETFMEKAFGKGCHWDRMKEQVLGGVGRDYVVQYAEGISYRLDLNWDEGYSRETIEFFPKDPASNPQAVERMVAPKDVIAVYSDEPDWLMDDDVPRLKDKGVTTGFQGTGTRILRHFWYEGQNVLGHDFGKDQELDQRMQLFYQLSLIAFSVDEPYWGYRFLGDALHYLEDLTQPFHVQAMMSDDMVYTADIIHGQLCEYHRGPDCKPGSSTVHEATTRSGWLTGTYHSIYEDYARGLVSQGLLDRRGSYWALIDPDRNHDRFEDIAPLDLRRDENGLLQMMPMVRQVQKEVLKEADSMGDIMIKTFTNKFRYHPELQKRELGLSGQPSSFGFQFSLSSVYGPGLSDDDALTTRQYNARVELKNKTDELLGRLGFWGRQFIESTLGGLNDQGSSRIAMLREQFAHVCVEPSPAPGARSRGSRRRVPVSRP
jgi:hypothetical protein